MHFLYVVNTDNFTNLLLKNKGLEFFAQLISSSVSILKMSNAVDSNQIPVHITAMSWEKAKCIKHEETTQPQSATSVHG